MPTFTVTDVSPCKTPLTSTTLPEALTRALAGPAPVHLDKENEIPPPAARDTGRIEASGSNLSNLVTTQLHGFLGAAHHAFSSHYPLVISPDDVWLCIAQGLATHIDLNADALRDRLVRHQHGGLLETIEGAPRGRPGKEQIQIKRDEFVKGSPDNDWPGCFAEFSQQIAERIGKKRDLVVADFTTTGPIEKAASEIVLMAAMRHYFDYRVVTMCGIPSVTLLGSVDDWKSIRRRAAVLAELDLEWWVSALLPVLDQLVAAASGKPDRAFWQSLYKWKGGSGGPYITGWINVLFPYVEGSRRELDPDAPPGTNCFIYDPETGKMAPVPPFKYVRAILPNEAATTWSEGLRAELGGGPNPGDFPGGLLKAPFVWEYLGAPIPMEFVGGFVGVSQDPETLAVRPAIGWAVKEAPSA